MNLPATDINECSHVTCFRLQLLQDYIFQTLGAVRQTWDPLTSLFEADIGVSTCNTSLMYEDINLSVPGPLHIIITYGLTNVEWVVLPPDTAWHSDRSRIVYKSHWRISSTTGLDVPAVPASICRLIISLLTSTINFPLYHFRMTPWTKTQALG